MKADIGVIGLAVMGENLILNMANHGFKVAAYNRTTSRVDAFLKGRARGKSIVGAHSLEELCSQLDRPRKILLMVKAGQAVDDCIQQLMPQLDRADIIIDGGNSHFSDSTRRMHQVENAGMLFIGTGVSGGEEGALRGPSIMPGGSHEAWVHVQPLLQAVAAKTPSGEPCCNWVGPEGAGHFVKMVHNGIEYGDMQLICEAYDAMRRGLGMSQDETRDVFDTWNRGELDSYLVEITRDILGYRDENGQSVLERILDTAGQKGTGKWTVQASLDIGQPLSLVGEAVFARYLSAMKEERVKAAEHFTTEMPAYEGDRAAFIDSLRQALYASKIMSYAQGYSLMRATAEQQNWRLDFGDIAMMWQGGCIIRSVFLENIKAAFQRDAELPNLLFDPFFGDAIRKASSSWRKVVSNAVLMGIPIPAMSSAMAYFDGYRSDRLPANLIQAQRDYFGAHTYERVDRPRGQFFHTNWTGHGGQTASSAYSA